MTAATWPTWPPYKVGSKWKETQRTIAAAWKAWAPARHGAHRLLAAQYYSPGPFNSLARPPRATVTSGHYGRERALPPPNGRNGKWQPIGPFRTCHAEGWWQVTRGSWIV